MTYKITILGCGNSAGVPAICNHWGQCDPDEPRNRRTRPSIAVQSETTTLIVDTSPDFRAQINRENIPRVDAVLYTHVHSDHVAGIDDLRILRLRQKHYIDIYGVAEDLDVLRQRFDYLFVEQAAIYPRVVEPHVIENLNSPMSIGDINFIPFAQDHGTCTSLGLRFGDLAYSTDVVRLDEAALKTLAGIKTWVLDGAAYKMTENPVHFNLRQVYEMNEIVRAERVIITHMPPSMDYRTLLKELPQGFEPAYDGLVLEALV